MSVEELVGDLAGEHAALDALVADLDPARWRRPTASPGWDVADQIGHLTYFDRAATTALRDPEAFRASVTALVEGASREGLDAFTLSDFRAMSPDELLAAWRDARGALLDAASRAVDGVRVDWYGPAMSPSSFLSARLMETWAHGTDVADALALRLPATDRLRHVARLGVVTRRWSYVVRGEEPPSGEVRVELTGPGGEAWVWGSDEAEDVIAGPAEDFCLVVVQRRHVDDTALTAGELGRHWLDRAQAFAGGPSDGPAPRGARGAG